MAKRLLSLTLIGLLALNSQVAPAFALSTSGEIAQARRTDREVVTEQGVVQNPLLNAWVDRIAASDWRFVGRKDVPYSIKILDEGDVNAFTTGGGFIYINAGALDFVASDDELAGVIGHETGHNEHRHPITLRQRSELLSILFGLAAIVAPVSIGLGTFAEEGLMAHASRTDEYQADQYGLMVMTSAGYDPDAMVSFMRRLGDATSGEQVDAYLADHPGVPERIKRLRSYRELSPTYRTPEKRLADALHDEQTSRYAIAQEQFQRVLAVRPQSATAWLGLGRVQVALGLTARARQSFTKAAQLGDHAQQAAANAEIHALPFAPFIGMPPKDSEIVARRQAIITERASLQHTSEDVWTEVGLDRERLSSLQARLTELSNDTGDLAGLRDEEKSDTSLPHQLEKLGRNINATVERATTVLNGVGTLTPGRESGVLADASEVMQEIANLVSGTTLPVADVPQIRAIPTMLDTVKQGEGELRTSVTQTTQALLQLSRALDQFDVFLHVAKELHEELGDSLDLKSNARLRESAAQTQAIIKPALAAGNVADEAYNRARALMLENRITLLGVDASVASNEDFRRAVAQRCGIAAPSQAVVASNRLTPGEVAAATILAAEKQQRADDFIAQVRARHEAFVTTATAAHSDALALEIFLGLIYLDYTDELPKQT